MNATQQTEIIRAALEFIPGTIARLHRAWYAGESRDVWQQRVDRENLLSDEEREALCMTPPEDCPCRFCRAHAPVFAPALAAAS